MYDKAGLETRLAQHSEQARESTVRCDTLVLKAIIYCCGCAAGCALA
jgi:hypothetical protein